MNIVRKTKWALLELFPEQKETEAEAEEAAWKKAREAEAQAEAEAKEKEAAEAAEAEGEEEKKSESALDQIEAEMASIDLAKKVKTDTSGEKTEPESPQKYDPETHEVPISELPEGERAEGILVLEYAKRGVNLDVQCSPEQIVEAAKILDAEGFCLESVSGVDWIKEDQMEVIYDYNRTDNQFCRVAVRVRIPRTEPSVPTISSIYPGANWHERETHEFFGIKFEGHPYLVPLLLPEDADFHPLLKDFTP
jgi:NADH-quinone oxidoreductase subunit C